MCVCVSVYVCVSVCMCVCVCVCERNVPNLLQLSLALPNSRRRGNGVCTTSRSHACPSPICKLQLAEPCLVFETFIDLRAA